MAALQCDVCGGKLTMDAGGKSATCDFCGLTHSLERMREKVQEIKGTVRIEGTVQARQTGTDEDVAQWRALLRKYMAAHDYMRAEGIVSKILEAVPGDEEANGIYDQMQELKYFEIKSGVLTRYHGRSKTVTVPDGVTEIGERAFSAVDSRGWDAAPVEKLILPKSVTVIGEGAFSSCAELREIVWPDGLTEIKDGAFQFCSGLQKIVLPKGVTVIGESAFCDCTGLREIVLPNGLTEIKYLTFEGCSGLQEIVLPKGVTVIGKNAFSGCAGLREIVLPDGLTKIGCGAFRDCTGLKRAVFPHSLTRIDDFAFYETDNLTDIVFTPKPNKKLYVDSFNGKVGNLFHGDEDEY